MGQSACFKASRLFREWQRQPPSILKTTGAVLEANRACDCLARTLV
jgi:hypothetical protein